MDIINKHIQKYAESYSSREPSVLAELNRETYVRHLFPRMLSGHHQGRFLSILSHMLKPSCVLEVGPYTGYSAICLAEGLTEGGVLHTIEINNENEGIIRKYLAKSGMEDKIRLHFGDALEIIPGIHETFDLDAEKERYIDYFDLVFGKVRSGGIVLADNVLWDGKVLNDKDSDKESAGIRRFNNYLRSKDHIEHVLLTIRDGIMIIRKK